MTKEEVLHLAELARIALKDEEVALLQSEIDDVLAYVDQIKELAGGEEGELKVGFSHNVFREDKDPHEPGIYTEDLLSAAPKRDGQYIEVKKILNND